MWISLLVLGVGWEIFPFTKLELASTLKLIFKPNHFISAASVWLTKHFVRCKKLVPRNFLYR